MAIKDERRGLSRPERSRSPATNNSNNLQSPTNSSIIRHINVKSLVISQVTTVITSIEGGSADQNGAITSDKRDKTHSFPIKSKRFPRHSQNRLINPRIFTSQSVLEGAQQTRTVAITSDEHKAQHSSPKTSKNHPTAAATDGPSSVTSSSDTIKRRSSNPNLHSNVKLTEGAQQTKNSAITSNNQPEIAADLQEIQASPNSETTRQHTSIPNLHSNLKSTEGAQQTRTVAITSNNQPEITTDLREIHASSSSETIKQHSSIPNLHSNLKSTEGAQQTIKGAITSNNQPEITINLQEIKASSNSAKPPDNALQSQISTTTSNRLKGFEQTRTVAITSDNQPEIATDLQEIQASSDGSHHRKLHKTRYAKTHLTNVVLTLQESQQRTVSQMRQNRHINLPSGLLRLPESVNVKGLSRPKWCDHQQGAQQTKMVRSPARHIRTHNPTLNAHIWAQQTKKGAITSNEHIT